MSGPPAATATASFVVNGPTAGTYFTAIPGQLNVWPAGIANNGKAVNPWLELGNALTVNGIEFSVTDDAVSSISGAGTNASFQWVQLINSRTDQYRTNPSTPNGTQSTGLDNWYPYVVASGDPNYTNDSPGMELYAHDGQGNPIPIGEGASTFSATMYLMWDPAPPSGCEPAKTLFDPSTRTTTSSPSQCTESIPVPLADVSWGYCGDAINTLAYQASTRTTWLLDCGGPQPVTPTVKQTSTFPQWNTTDFNQ